MKKHFTFFLLRCILKDIRIVDRANADVQILCHLYELILERYRIKLKNV